MILIKLYVPSLSQLKRLRAEPVARPRQPSVTGAYAHNVQPRAEPPHPAPARGAGAAHLAPPRRPERPGYAGAIGDRPGREVTAATALVGRFGTAAIAGYGVGARLEYLLVPLVFGLGAPLVALVGTNIGAGQRARAVQVAWIGSAIGFVGGILLLHWTGELAPVFLALGAGLIALGIVNALALSRGAWFEKRA